MSGPRHDFWFTVQNTEDGSAEIRPVDNPRNRTSEGRYPSVVIPLAEMRSASPSPLSEVDEELLEKTQLTPNSSPFRETAGTKDVAMTDVCDNSAPKTHPYSLRRLRSSLGRCSTSLSKGISEMQDHAGSDETRPSAEPTDIQGMFRNFGLNNCTKTSNPTTESEHDLEEDTRSSASSKDPKDLLAAFQAKPSVNKPSSTTDIDDDMEDHEADSLVSESASTQQQDVSPGASRVSYVLSENTGLFEIQETHEDPLSPSDLNNPSTEDSHLSPEITKSSLNAQQLRGIKGKLANDLRDILLEWHLHNPSDAPPCQWKGRWDGTKKWENFQIFDRDGEEHEISIYKIRVKDTKPGSYLVSVLHSQCGPDVLFGVSPEHRPNMKLTGYQGVFLTAWLGPTDGWEKEPFAIHVWAPEKTKIKFHVKWFDPEQGSKIALYKAQKYANKSPTTPKTPSSATVISISSGTDGLSTPCKKKMKHKLDSDSESEDVVGPTTRVCRRLFSPLSIRFKLLSNNSPTVRVFPFNDKTDIDTLFKKARQFYQDVSWTPETALLCRVPGEDEMRYIGAEDEEEFTLLCDDIKRLSIRAESVQVIEVKPASRGALGFGFDCKRPLS
ncbi:hypothetical protein N7456_000651 [Penicillium angulare]|uniref:Uncharacterized protein n=1 Tax=Penicillium angulare TaxID=116970 RepID=A0A9W9GDW8_9EURO|nr:hypothetical protein N7456_000651 [Penicillium angulare]